MEGEQKNAMKTLSNQKIKTKINCGCVKDKEGHRLTTSSSVMAVMEVVGALEALLLRSS